MQLKSFEGGRGCSAGGLWGAGAGQPASHTALAKVTTLKQKVSRRGLGKSKRRCFTIAATAAAVSNL